MINDKTTYMDDKTKFNNNKPTVVELIRMDDDILVARLSNGVIKAINFDVAEQNFKWITLPEVI